MRCCATPTPRCTAPSSWAATSTGATAGEFPGEIGSRSRALPGAVPRAHRGGGARLGGRCRLRAGARPGREARRRQRLRQRRCTASRPRARRHGCSRCRAGRRHLVPFLSDDEHRRARHHRSAPGSVRPYSRSRAGVFRSHPHRRGDISRLTNDTMQLQQVIGYGLSMFVRNLLMMTGAAVMLFVTSWKLALLVLLGVPATLVPILLLGRRVRRLSRSSQDRVADVSVYVDEAVHEIRTLQAYAHEDADRRSFAHHAEAAYRAGVARIRQKAWLISLVMLIAFCAVAIILWIGGHDVLEGRITVGELAAFVFYASVVASGAGTGSGVGGELQRAAGAAERLLELLDTRAQIVAPPVPAVLAKRTLGAVEFDHVRFAYPARPGIAGLERFSLRAAPGERLALVGPSGAGKSTVFALLLRFYDPQQGAVRIDGTDIRRMDPGALRRLVAVVPQEPVIFAASVLDNVSYARPEARREEVVAACARAFGMGVIARLPQGLDTVLGERGVTLSGGQRQRLSIARALLADRPILLLDEATSSLDAASERMVQQALEALESGRTTLAIAHRLATVQHADRIVVMERGAVVAQGTHAELMREGGLYASLARLQFLGDASGGKWERAA